MLLNVGFDNAVMIKRVVSIVSVNSTPVKRMIDEARKAGMLIDATRGKKIKSVVITDSNHYLLSALQTETLVSRCGGKEKGSPLPQISSPRSNHAPSDWRYRHHRNDLANHFSVEKERIVAV